MPLNESLRPPVVEEDWNGTPVRRVAIGRDMSVNSSPISEHDRAATMRYIDRILTEGDLSKVFPPK